MNRHIIIYIAALLTLFSCADTDQYICEDDEETLPTQTEAELKWETLMASASFIDGTDIVPTDELAEDYDDYIENEEFTRSVDIKYAGDTAYVSTDQGEDQVGVTVKGAHVTLNCSRKKLVISITGSTNDGSLKIYSENKFELRLNNISLQSQQGAAINVQSKKRMFLTLADGSENTLADATIYTDSVAGEDQKGCVFSEGQVIVTGTGNLNITGNYAHAFASDQYIFIHPGVQLRVTDAQKDGIRAKEGLRMTGGLLHVYAQKDAVQTDSVGVKITGGRLYACGKRAYTADPFVVTSPGAFIGVTPTTTFVYPEK